jgi:hypothetical protein
LRDGLLHYTALLGFWTVPPPSFVIKNKQNISKTEALPVHGWKGRVEVVYMAGPDRKSFLFAGWWLAKFLVSRPTQASNKQHSFCAIHYVYVMCYVMLKMLNVTEIYLLLCSPHWNSDLLQSPEAFYSSTKRLTYEDSLPGNLQPLHLFQDQTLYVGILLSYTHT